MAVETNAHPRAAEASDTLRIEFLFLDLTTCTRCLGAYRNLEELGGLTQASAAAQLGLSTSGMKSRVQRARVQLRQLLVACCEMDLARRGDVMSYRSRRSPCDCRTDTRGAGGVTPYPARALPRPAIGLSE